MQFGFHRSCGCIPSEHPGLGRRALLQVGGMNLVGMGLTLADIQTLGSNSGGDFLINFNNVDFLRIVGRLENSLSDSDFILG